MKETIEKLKNNLAQFEYCSHAEKIVFEKVGIKNCRELSIYGNWRKCESNNFIPKIRYRINPIYIYQEEKEIEYNIFDVFIDENGLYSFKDHEEIECLVNAFECEPKYAGVQFKGQVNKDEWRMIPYAFIRDGILSVYDDGSHKIAVLDKIRFIK